MQTGGQLAHAVIESAGPVGRLFDPRARRDDHRQNLIDRLSGDAGRYSVEYLVDGGAPDAGRDVVVGVVVDGDQFGFLRLPGQWRRDRFAEVRRQLEHEVIPAVIDTATCLPGCGGTAVGVDERHGHLVHVTEGVPERPQVQRAVHQWQQHQRDDRHAGQAAAAETLDLRAECESSQHCQSLSIRIR